jgi:hypothetical protein
MTRVKDGGWCVSFHEKWKKIGDGAFDEVVTMMHWRVHQVVGVLLDVTWEPELNWTSTEGVTVVGRSVQVRVCNHQIRQESR